MFNQNRYLTLYTKGDSSELFLLLQILQMDLSGIPCSENVQDFGQFPPSQSAPPYFGQRSQQGPKKLGKQVISYHLSSQPPPSRCFHKSLYVCILCSSLFSPGAIKIGASNKILNNWNHWKHRVFLMFNPIRRPMCVTFGIILRNHIWYW